MQTVDYIKANGWFIKGETRGMGLKCNFVSYIFKNSISLMLQSRTIVMTLLFRSHYVRDFYNV